MSIIRRIDRTLLEVVTAGLCWTLLGMLLPVLPIPVLQTHRLEIIISTGFSGILVCLALAHMQRNLDKALQFDEGTASKLLLRGYLIRYIALAVLVILSAGVEILNPLVICLAYIIIMKLAVYSQPFAHKFYNKLFHESDPAFEDLPAEEEVIQ